MIFAICLNTNRILLPDVSLTEEIPTCATALAPTDLAHREALRPFDVESPIQHLPLMAENKWKLSVCTHGCHGLGVFGFWIHVTKTKHVKVLKDCLVSGFLPFLPDCSLWLNLRPESCGEPRSIEYVDLAAHPSGTSNASLVANPQPMHFKRRPASLNVFHPSDRIGCTLHGLLKGFNCRPEKTSQTFKVTLINMRFLKKTITHAWPIGL